MSDSRRGIAESDWKIFRELSPLAVDRLCKRILAELVAKAGDESQSAHERYRDIYRLIKERDEDIAAAFDGPSRSRASIQITFMRRFGLLTPAEVGRFSEDMQRITRPLSERE